MDLKVVVLVPTDGPDYLQFDRHTPLTHDAAVIMTVSLEPDGWKIAAWTERVPRAGMPPDLYPDVV